ncbi:hypothetical protein BY996DRAFT_6411272 [Phakopsora pachyrhizi]|nr:hypothetical protein BY996DRAFT_6411272 [Phakopsora pachyrhizi]
MHPLHTVETRQLGGERSEEFGGKGGVLSGFGFILLLPAFEFEGVFPPSLSAAIRVRTLYAYKSQCPEDLSLVENIVIEAHPSKIDNDWLYGTDVKSGRAGTFPKAYVTELEVTWGKVLYGYTASSADEVSLIEDEMVVVVDTSDPDWFKVKEQGRVGLAPGACIELSNCQLNGCSKFSNYKLQNYSCVLDVLNEPLSLSC